MSTKTKFTVRYRRRREDKTDYKKRLQLLKSGKERIVIRKTNQQIIIQITQYNQDGDKVLLTVQSSELKKIGWKHSTKNIPAAYLAGMLAAKKAKQHKVQEAILDIGLQTPIHGNKIFAALKGAIDGGLKIPANQTVFPKDERIKGEHIANHTEKSKNIKQDFEKLKQELQK